MAIEVDPSDLDPANLPPEVEGAALYRYGGSFYTGEQEGLILECFEHVSKAKKAEGSSAPSSICLRIGIEGQPTTDGTPPKVRFDEYVGLGKDRFSSEKRQNLFRVLQPELARVRGSFNCASHVGKRVKLLIEAEDEGGEYGTRPRVTRLISVIGVGAPAAAPRPAAPASAPAPAQAQRAAPVLSDDEIPF